MINPAVNWNVCHNQALGLRVCTWQQVKVWMKDTHQRTAARTMRDGDRNTLCGRSRPALLIFWVDHLQQALNSYFFFSWSIFLAAWVWSSPQQRHGSCHDAEERGSGHSLNLQEEKILWAGDAARSSEHLHLHPRPPLDLRLNSTRLWPAQLSGSAWKTVCVWTSCILRRVHVCWTENSFNLINDK